LREISKARYIIYYLTVPQILAFLSTKGSRQQVAYQSRRLFHRPETAPLQQSETKFALNKSGKS